MYENIRHADAKIWNELVNGLPISSRPKPIAKLRKTANKMYIKSTSKKARVQAKYGNSVASQFAFIYTTRELYAKWKEWELLDLKPFKGHLIFA